MSFLSKIASRVGIVTRSEMKSFVDSLQTIMTGSVGGVNPQELMRSNRLWVYTCVRAVAEEVGRINYQLFDKKGGKNGKYQRVDDHELLTLLNRPNKYQTGKEFRYLISSYLDLVGAVYILKTIKGVPCKTAQQPDELHILPSERTKIKLSGNLLDPIAGYSYQASDKKIDYEPDAVMYIKFPNPSDPIRGMGTVEGIIDWISADRAATVFNAAFFENGTRLSGVLQSEKANTKDQIDLLRYGFENIHRGVVNSYKTAVLPKGVEFKELGQNQKDMDFVNLQKEMRDKILSAFRVSKTILGTAESDTNRATAETADYIFAARTIRPKMELIVGMLNELLVPLFSKTMYLGFDDPVPENRALELQELQAALPGQSTMSINEARERYFGLPPIKGGNSVMGNYSMQPIGEPAQDAPAGKSKSIVPNDIPRREKGSEKIAGIIVAHAMKLAQEKAAKVREENKSITTLTDDEFLPIYKDFDQRMRKHEAIWRKSVQGFNDKQREEVLKNLSSSVKAVDVSALFNLDEWVGAMVDVNLPIATALFDEEGKAAAALLGLEIDPLTSEAKKAIARAVTLLSDSYNQTTRDLLQNKLTQGQEEGLNINELADIVNEVFDYNNQVRAQMVAETETVRIGNEATKSAWKQTGVVETVKWYTVEDEKVCPFCAPLHGTTVGIDENFFDKGSTVEGNDGTTMSADYDNIGNPPLHVSCRCYIRPEKINF